MDKYIEYLNKETGYNWRKHGDTKLTITIKDAYKLENILKSKNIPYRILMVNHRSIIITIGVDIKDITGAMICDDRDMKINEILK